MSRRTLVAVFEREEDLLGAIATARGSGHEVLDVYAPYPVHGLDDAAGLRPSRLPWACFLGGLAGAAVGFGFQVWSSSVDWPLNVGGKPLNSVPAFVPVAFELVILFAGLGTFLAFLVATGLRPRRVVKVPAERLMDDRFALVLGATDASYDADALRETFATRHRAVEVEERLEGDAT